MLRSQKIAIKALIFAAIVTGLLYFWLRFFPWWAYAIVFVIAFVAALDHDMKRAAQTRIVDGKSS